MLLEFSNHTVRLLKFHLPNIAQLSWDENKLDLTHVRQLKGCRTELVGDCLTFIQKLDSLVINSDQEKNYVNNTIRSLIASLKKYNASCEYYPRIKDFLNIIPDNVTGIVVFTLLISSLLTTVFPPLAVIPLLILSWIIMDLFFNNREEAKAFKDTLYTAKDELNTIEKTADILNKSYPAQNINQTNNSPAPIPSTSGTSFSFYGTVNNQGGTSGINSEHFPESSAASLLSR